MRNVLRGLLIACVILPLSLQADDCAVDWNVVSPKYDPGYQRAIIYINDQFLAVGDGRVFRSTDGLDWKSHTINANLNDVMWLDNRYIGASDKGIWGSTDGLEWTQLQRNDMFANKLLTDGQTIVAISSPRGNNLWRSTDGGNAWVRHSLGAQVQLDSSYSVWNGQHFVVIGEESSQTALWRSTDGRNWEKLTINGFNRLEKLAFDGTHYIALGYRDAEPTVQYIVRSTNLVDWDILQQRDPDANKLLALSWVDGRYIATSSIKGRIETSMDGSNWTSHVVTGTSSFVNLHDIATNGQTYVATINRHNLLISDNLMDWYSPVLIATHLHDIAASPQRFVALSDDSTVSEILTSTDGNTWVAQQAALDQQLYGVEWFKDRFLAWGPDKSQGSRLPVIYTSQNGITWTRNAVENQFDRLFSNVFTKSVAGPDHVIAHSFFYADEGVAISEDGLNWQYLTLNAPNQTAVVLGDGIWDGGQFVFTAHSYTINEERRGLENLKLLTATTVNGQQWTFREVNTNAQFAHIAYNGESSIAYNGNTYVIYAINDAPPPYYNVPALYTSTDLTQWTQQHPKIVPFTHHDYEARTTELYWTGHEFLLAGALNLRSKDGVTWQQVIAPYVEAVASTGQAVVGVGASSVAFSQCLSATESSVLGVQVTDALHIRAVINTDQQHQRLNYIEARWRQGGEATTARGDRVVWGYFYADPADVDWGSADNPELFVKIWFDVSGRIDVNYFHVSVPNIDVYTSFNGDLNVPDQYSRTNTTDRYVRHVLHPDGRSELDIRQEDGISAAMPTLPANTPNLYRILEAFRAEDSLSIGTQIQTETAGTLDGLWFSGGEAETNRGDLVAWGYFYADPQAVDWGDANNPEVFVKVWFDVNGRIDTNYFHVSVPSINLFSNYTKQGNLDEQYGLTHTQDRYTRHVFWGN